MVTKAQIERIAARIEALAPKSDRVVGVWRNRGETAEEAAREGTISRRQLIVSLDKLTSSGG